MQSGSHIRLFMRRCALVCVLLCLNSVPARAVNCTKTPTSHDCQNDGSLPVWAVVLLFLAGVVLIIGLLICMCGGCKGDEPCWQPSDSYLAVWNGSGQDGQYGSV